MKWEFDVAVNKQQFCQLNLQREALKVLLPKVRGINFGPAIVIKNDCVDGVARLATFILPINKSMDAEIFSNFGTPKQYQREMARVFPNLAGKLFDFTNIRSHNPANETPSTGMEVIFEDLRQTHSFKEFRSYESLWALLWVE